MNYTQLLNAMKQASLFDLYRLNVAIRHEMENPVRVQGIRYSLREGSTVHYFDSEANKTVPAIVLQRNPKYVVVKNTLTGRNWKIPYYMLNLEGVDTDIQSGVKERLTRNHFSVGDSVGFQHDGVSMAGAIIRLNPKTASIMTTTHKRWRVSYNLLFKVIDGEFEQHIDLKQIAQEDLEETAE
ncbi:MAG: hypothetical protein HKM04_09265 [Legionellales bacterium]|nr:hypothetical protein [Legionellales bacterium]